MAYRDITSSIRNYASAQADTNENLYEVKDILNEVKYNVDRTNVLEKRAVGARRGARALDIMSWMDKNDLKETSEQAVALDALSQFEGWLGESGGDWMKMSGYSSPDSKIDIDSPKSTTLMDAYKTKEKLIPDIKNKIGGKYNKDWWKPKQKGWSPLKKVIDDFVPNSGLLYRQKGDQ
tara:strand:+ start:132 stop:665 length:534 start_codon:yes stop_codon:yes gene_type:complete